MGTSGERRGGLRALTVGVVAVGALAFAGTGLAHTVKYDSAVTTPERGSVGGDDTAWYGDVSSPQSKCLSGRKVIVHRAGDVEDVVGSDKTGRFIEPGHYEVRPGEGYPPPDGTYFAVVKKKNIGKRGHHHICKGAESDGFTSDGDVDGDGYDFTLDCDDSNPAIYPGATEVFNGMDDNCDGTNDEGLDLDHDGYAFDDCDDGDPAVYPGATEIAGNGTDDDCDGVTDEAR